MGQRVPGKATLMSFDHETQEKQRLREIARLYGYGADVLGEDAGVPEPPAQEAGGSIKMRDVALAMGKGSPFFAYSTPTETPYDQLQKGDKVSVWKRGTGEREFMYGMVHDVNISAGEVHLEFEGGLRSINVNDYLFVREASAPDGQPGNLAPGQTQTGTW